MSATRRLAIMILGLCAASSVQAQSYFNLRDPLHSFSSILTSVVPKNGKYYCSGITWDSSNHISGTQAWDVWGVRFAVYSESGNKLRDTVYQRSFQTLGLSQGRVIDPWPNSLQPTPDGTFILAAYSYDYDSPTNVRAALIKLDTLGRCTMFREYDKPFCQNRRGGLSHHIRDLKPDGHSGWLLLTQPLCAPGNPVLRHDYTLTKLDSAFDVVWDRQYTNGNNNTVATKILVEPDGYLLAGGRDNRYQTNIGFTHRAQLIKTDTAGNELWRWESDPAKKIYSAADVVRTADGGYLYCGWGDGFERISANGQSATMYWNSWVKKLDANRNPEWRRVLSDIRWGYGTNELTVAKELSNGDIVVAGGLKHRPSPLDSFTQGYGQLARLGPDGTIRWQRKYRYASDTFEHTVHDMKLTPDGGFVLVGQSTDQKYPYNPPNQRSWIIKVDSNGCTSTNDPQCWPAVIEAVMSAKDAVLVYPNPATSILNVRYASKQNRATTIYVTDLAGRRIFQAELQDGETPLSISRLLPGLYLWHITGDGLEKARGKFVKQ